jgi:group I intron endonuclease
MEIKIYCLIDPITNEIRYIGKTKNSLTKRLYEHLTKRNLKPNTHKNNWIKQLLSNKLKPIISLIELTDDKNWIEREIYHIKTLKEKGIKLTNTTEGGDGALGTKQTIESKEKRRKTMLSKYGSYGIKITEEQKKSISLAQTGRVKTIDEIEKQASKLRKNLIQLDLDENIIKIWDGVRKCSREIGVDYTTLRYAINNQKPLNGFIWKYQ